VAQPPARLRHQARALLVQRADQIDQLIDRVDRIEILTAKPDPFDLLDPEGQAIHLDRSQAPVSTQPLLGLDLRGIHIDVRSDRAANRSVRGISHGGLLLC
jgi:hypothetical protein